MPDIDSILDSVDKALEKSFKKLDKEIENILLDLPLDAGKTKAAKLERLSNLSKTRKAVFEQMNGASGKISEEMKKSFGKLETEYLKTLKAEGITTSFTEIDKKALDALQSQIISGSEYLMAENAQAVASDIYTSVLTGTLKRDLISAIKNKIIGTDKGGRPLSQYSKVYAQDMLMEYYSTANMTKTEGLGINKFRYEGNLIKDSRSFCKLRAGNTYTRKQIESWQRERWAGKKPGNIFIVRGGWNCRHHFTPIVSDFTDEELAELEKKVESLDLKKITGKKRK